MTFQELVIDASAFLRYFGMVIAKSAPHIYISALPFAPISSHVSRHYFSIFPNTLSVKCGRLPHWPAVEMVIPVEGRLIVSVTFSQDGQRIVSGLSDGTIRVWNATAAEMDIAKQVDFTDQSTINSEGWICGSKDELLVWIPQIHRLSLHRPRNIWVAGEHETRLDLSSFMHGPDWATCLNS